MYVIRWKKDSTYLVMVDPYRCLWDSIEKAKTFLTEEEAVQYVSKIWNLDRMSIDKIHPLNLRPL